MHERNVPNSMSLREILVFVYKYRRRLVWAFCVPFALALALAFFSSPRFEATSVLIVRLGSEYVYRPEVGSSQTSAEAPIPYQQDQIFKSEAAILASKDLHKQVIETIGPDELYPAGFLRSVVGGVFSFLADVPVFFGLKAPLSEEQKEVGKVAAAGVVFEKRLDVVLEKQSAVINVSFQHKDAQKAVLALDTLLKLFMEKRKQLYLEPRLDLAQEQAEAARRAVVTTSRQVDLFKRRNKLHSLEVQRANLLASRDEVERQKVLIDNPALDQKSEHYNRELEALDALEQKFSVVDHESKIAKEAYAMAVHKVSEAKAFDDLSRQRVGSVRVIQNATVSPYPVNIRPLILMAGIFLSILSFFCVAAITEFGRSGFLTPEELERSLNVPVLAVLPFFAERK